MRHGERRSRALDVLAATLPSHDLDLEHEQRQQAALAKIRHEIMDIARDVAKLRRAEAETFAPPTDPRPFASRSAPTQTGAPKRLKITARPSQAAAAPQPQMRSQETRERSPAPAQPKPLANKRPRQHPPNNSPGGTSKPAASAPGRNNATPRTIGDEVKRFAPAKPKKPAAPNAKQQRGLRQRLKLNLATKAALLAGVMIIGAGLITLTLLGKLPWQGHLQPKLSLMLAHIGPQATSDLKAAKPAALLPASAGEQATAAPFEMPDTYGVYAISDGHLTALEPLPIRVPDARVSISSTISKPAPAPLNNGNLMFAVYHRELATNVPESASVRIVAKVMQATTFVGSKPKAIPVEDSWAVRGGAVDLRIAPVAANKEMILIRPADPSFTLAPGRYVLMFRNQAYDFSVAGEVTDTSHCLERSDLQDRSVYSECRELPAKP